MALRVATQTFQDRHLKATFSATSAPSARSTPHSILQLHHTLGNHAVQRLIQAKRIDPQLPLPIQAKVMVGPPGDKYEQEADHVANRVMTMPDPSAPKFVQRAIRPEEEKEKTLQPKPLANSITPLVQRQLAPEEKDENPVQAKPWAASISPFVQRQMTTEKDKEKKPVQAKLSTDSSGSRLQREMGTEEEKEKGKHPVQARSAEERTVATETVEGGSDFETRLSRGSGGGSRLPEHVRSYMEPRFGVDFSGVRVHTDREAAELNRAVGAQTFTHGHHIYFGAGKGPGISDLMAHELTHVIQQTGRKPLHSLPAKRSCAASRRIQRYSVPATLDCGDVVDWLDNNSPYSPEWAETHCTYTFHGNVLISRVTSGSGVTLTVSGHKDLWVSVSCPIDSPQWSPSPRQNRPAVVAAWRGMKASLDAHEQQHRAIGRTWRATLEARFRAMRFTVTGADHADAMSQVRQEVASLQQQWIADAQADQDAIDPFRGAVLNCP